MNSITHKAFFKTRSDKSHKKITGSNKFIDQLLQIGFATPVPAFIINQLFIKKACFSFQLMIETCVEKSKTIFLIKKIPHTGDKASLDR